ncbi:MAG TPA: protein kinase [Thermoanaerobaculia bacterium]|nr:protein kinase [Thermoanaerobaculia bacterium]
MTLAAGTRLGPYEVVSPLGAGGMGEVYRAKDTRLGRMVAVKVLPQHLSASAEVRQRFEREAKTVSQLSHPHICALYDVGREGDVDYLVMELLEGETLSERLVRGSLPLEQTLRFGQEIADALDKAHRQGIVHRDLKPANVMLTKSGVKLLDFGLAKAMAPEAAKGSLTSLPTQQGLTQEGTILGTFQYMAPEQLEGKEADARTDVFAFGAVLYEMATGKKAFSASSQASLITAIMSSDPPPISSAIPMSPPALDHVVKACLAKDPEDRWQSAADIDRELRWIREQSGAAEHPPVEKRRGRSFLPWIGWAAAALLAAALLLTRRHSPGASSPAAGPLHFALSLRGDRLPIPSPDGTNPIVLLPNGRGLVYCAVHDASTELKYLDLATGQARSIPGTTGAVNPFLSPDSRWIGFNVADTLRKVALDGGTPFDIFTGAVARGACWGADGSIYFTPDLYGGISRVSAEGGQAQIVTKPAAGERTHRWPEVLPGGRGLVYAVLGRSAKSWDDAEIVLQRLDAPERRVLVHGGTTPHYLPTGHLVYARAGSLFAVPFDPKTLTVGGAPFEVARDVYIETTGNAFATFADTGLLVHAAASAVQVNRILTRVDRTGRGERVTDRAEAYVQLALSPDGSRVLSDFDSSIWVLDLRRQTFAHLPAPFRLNLPIWAPDGKRIVYSSEKNGPWNVFWRLADGTGDEHDVLVGPRAQVPIEVSRDGRWMLVQGGESFNELIVVPLADLEPSGPPRKVASGRALLGSFSPDGRWVVSAVPESGRTELFVVPTEGGEGRWQISTAGGSVPRWSPRGDEIFYLEGEKLMAVPVSTGPRFEAGPPRTLFSKPELRVFDVEPDAQHFILAELPAPSSGNLAVIENWFAQVVARSAEAQKK